MARTRFGSFLSRTCRGIQSAILGWAFPLGGWWLGDRFGTAPQELLTEGLVLVLPGVEGRGPLNWSIARGLLDGGWRGAILIRDWTTGWWPLFAYHLRAQR